jgi:hypothetical protein
MKKQSNKEKFVAKFLAAGLPVAMRAAGSRF